MDPREQRGLAIAATCTLKRNGDTWLVPSQAVGKRHKYIVRPQDNYCSCLDHDTRGVKCKHLSAVEFAMKREENPDGSTTVTQNITITDTVRKTYAQDWPAYNAAQTNE